MTAPASARMSPHRAGLLVAAILALGTALAYWNALEAPFVLDDLTSIKANPTIRQLWPPDAVLATPRGTGNTVDGRPLLNLSFAINYAIGGIDPRGYHLVNFLIHLLNGCLIYGVFWRTLRRPPHIAHHTEAAIPLAAAMAVVWTLHPLATSAVTYTAQRAESLMAFWFLLAVYAFIRGVDGKEARPRTWRSLAVVACFAGVATKEVMVAAPLVLLLYDRTFVAGTFRSALRAHGIMHGLFGASWLLVAWLVLGGGSRAGTAGLETAISPWHYALTQCGAVLHYLRLCFWPVPLVFDYGTSVVTRFADVWPQAALLSALVGAVAFALWRRPVIGFLGATFFLILAPSSSVIPVATQTIAEHRMYLPLAAVIALLVGTGARWLGWRRTAAFGALLAPFLGFATHRRNADYQSDVALWQDTVRKRPDNARAFVHLGTALVRARDSAAAREAFAAAIRVAPDNSEAHLNLGNLELAEGRVDQAVHEHREAVRLRPDSAAAHASLGFTLLAARRPADALPAFAEARRIDPDLPGLEAGLGLALVDLGRASEALPHLEHAAQNTLTDAAAHYNLANALIALQRRPEAMRALETALRLDPDHIPAHNNLGNLLLLSRRAAEAVPHFKIVLQAHPDSATAHTNLGLALILTGDRAGAEVQFREALRLDPNHAPARTNLELLEAAR